MYASLNEYHLFQGISPKDQQMLLPCINARLAALQPGQTLPWGPESAGLVLDGRCTAADGSIAAESASHENSSAADFGPNSLLLFDAPVMLSAREPCLILRMDRHMMFSPCWFSCSFHHRLMSNAAEPTTGRCTCRRTEPPAHT
ncbi:MAG: hypothetical protein IJ109_05045 [Firmicutes bacterium]|nr:hypothetical protein [Bacillota bacterium]